MSAGLRLNQINLRFGGVTVARDINLTLEPGARRALIGPNGAGKTTLANLISGSLAPDTGTIELDGKDITRLGEAARVRAGIARTFQITSLFQRLTVRENLRLPILQRKGISTSMFRRADGDPATEAEIDELLARFGLSALRDRPVEVLAYGQQRLVEIALALALKPRILILDEPAAGVPSTDTHHILAAIEALPDDLALLIIEHDMDLVFRVARAITVLSEGTIIAEGTPEEISANPRVRSVYLGGRHG